MKLVFSLHSVDNSKLDILSSYYKFSFKECYNYKIHDSTFTFAVGWGAKLWGAQTTFTYVIRI